MEFELSQEQRMLEASVGRLLADRDAAKLEGAAGWLKFAELGLPGMAFAEDDDGLGAGPVEAMIVMRAIGRELAAAPFMASAIFATELLKATGASAWKAALVPSLLDGSARLAVAFTEPGSRGAALPVETLASRRGDGFTISGRKVLVLGGDAATHLIVSARLAGADGIGLFLLPADAPGIATIRYPTIDGRAATDLTFESVAVAGMLCGPNAGPAALEHAIDHATVAVINEAAGAMEAILAATVDHLKHRRQFGSPIGSFQALQHRAVDMLVEVEQAKSMALFATMQLSLPAAERRDAIVAAKLHVNRACQSVGEAAVQLHGAIGMTRECRAGRLFARLTACRVAFGDSEACLARLLPSAPDILAG